MPKFILIRRKAFRDLERDQFSNRFGSQANVRRPYMGIQAGEDVHSTITVVTRDGKKLDLLDLNSVSRTGKTKHYTNFIVQGFQRAAQEKYNIQETWGEEWLNVYGKKPEIFTVSGMLVSSKNFPWESEFWFNYENVLRSTKLAEIGGRIFLEIGNMFYTGYMLDAQATRSYEVENRVPFSFHFYITHVGSFEVSTDIDLKVAINPSDTTAISTIGGPAIDTHDGEYTKLQPSDENSTTYSFTSREVRKWKTVRNSVLSDLAPDLASDPHTAARVYGAWEGDQLPDSYADSLGAGFSGGDAPLGKSESERKDRGTFTPPFPGTTSGKSDFSSALDFLSNAITPDAVGNISQLVGTARQRAQEAIGALTDIGSDLIPEDPLSKLQSALERDLDSLRSAGPGFVRGLTNVLSSDPILSGFGFKAALKKSKRINNMRAATDVMKDHAPTATTPNRFPRPGIFFLP